MTTPDTKAIRAQMEALTGFTAGPWYTHNQSGDWGLGGAHSIHVADANPYEWDQCIAHVEYQTPYCLGEKPSVIAAANTAACNARLIAAAPDMRATILALCDTVDEMRADNERLGRDFNVAKYGQPDFAWGIHLETMAELNAEIERLRTIIDNLHAVEEKHRETANAEFHRANRLQVENERLRTALTKINVGDGWAAQIARAALAQKGDE